MPWLSTRSTKFCLIFASYLCNTSRATYLIRQLCSQILLMMIHIKRAINLTDGSLVDKIVRLSIERSWVRILFWIFYIVCVHFYHWFGCEGKYPFGQFLKQWLSTILKMFQVCFKYLTQNKYYRFFLMFSFQTPR